MPAPAISKYEDLNFVIKIDGKDLPADFDFNVLEVTVDTSLFMPDMFVILFFDDDMVFMDDENTFDIGKEVEILVGDKQLIKGEITAIEPDFSETSKATLLIRGYDKSHRLHRGKKTRTFVKQKDSDIIKKIAGEADLQTDIDATPITHPYLIQNNQTNMEFLQMRAHLLGYQIFVMDGKLYFKKGETDLGKSPDLFWTNNLRSFRPRLTAAHQTDKTIVQGWDANTKKIIKSEAKPNSKLNQGGAKKTGGDTAKSAFQSSATTVVVNQPVFTVDEAKAIAEGISNQMTRDFIEAEGESYGDPDLRAGKKVAISGVGSRFSGEYFITSATHIYRNGAYYTRFSVSGQRPNTITHLLAQQNAANCQPGRINGFVTGLVSSNKDEEDLGRVKVKFPWLLDPDGVEIDSHWARIAAPMAGQNNKGLYYLPEVDDEVLVGFEHGDMRYPYIVGALWSKKDQPPDKNANITADGKTNQWIIRSRSGHTLILDDTDGKEQIIIRDKTEKNEIILDSKENSLTINVDKDIAITAGGNITLKAGGDISIESKNWTLKTQQNSNIQASQNLSLKATQSGVFEAAQSLALKGSSQAKLESSGQTEVKGTQVGVKGSAMVEVQGGVIKLN